MLDTLSFGWRFFGCIAAFWLVTRAIRNRRKGAEPSATPTLPGRIGGHLAAQAVISTVSGLLGFNILVALMCILLAIPLWIAGAKVELPHYVKAWPRSLMSRVGESFSEKKEEITNKIDDVKDSVGEKAAGISRVLHISRVSTSQEAKRKKGHDVSSDEFWGGPPDPDPVTREDGRNELLAFDAMEPHIRLAALESATRATREDVPKKYLETFAPMEWYKIRIGRSTFTYETLDSIKMWKAVWTAEAEQRPGIDPVERALFTRMAPKVADEDREIKRVLELLVKLSFEERFAILNAAWKLKRPEPDKAHETEGNAKPEQEYMLRVCNINIWRIPHSTLEEIKNAVLAHKKEIERAELMERRDRPARYIAAAKEKAQDVAEGIKVKAEHVSSDLQQKAGEGIREGASNGVKTIVKKAFGY